MKREYGFTLIETAIAVFILMVSILAALGLEATSLKGSTKARALQKAAAVGDRIFQELRTTSDLSSRCAEVNGSEVDDLTVTCVATPCFYSEGELTCDDGIADPQLYDVAIEVSGGDKVLVQTHSYIRPTLPLGGGEENGG